jgi:hypothetical protein
MITYKFRVYLANGRTVDTVATANCPSTAQSMLESQYSGCKVICMGRA